MMAPIIDKEVFDAFHGRQELRDRLSGALGRMLGFYGFVLQAEEDEVVVCTFLHFPNKLHPFLTI